MNKDFFVRHIKLKELKFVVTNEKDIVQSWWMAGQLYEEEMLTFIKLNYKGGVFIDCGAYIGNHSVFFSALADRVFSFEPNVESFCHLFMNKYINNIENMSLYNIGLGDKKEKRKLYVDTFNGGTTRELTENLKRIYIVDFVTLDEFELENVTLIKIDVEGFELNVLKGAEQTIRYNLPALFIECATLKDALEIYGFLVSLNVGYRIYEKKFNNTPTFLFTTKQVEQETR
jgi:FkbM family methyltransferase